MTDPEQPSRITVRLAQNAAEIEAAQKLRYAVFYDECGAHPSTDIAAARRDIDYFDQFTDHLIVIDPDADAPSGVVGTYRLMHSEAATRAGRFYSSEEYDLTPLLSTGAKLLEMGRSCVAPDYRSMAVLQLLWSGIARYLSENEIDIMFGCASFHGTDPGAIAAELSLLYHNHMAPEELRVRALSNRYVNMNILPREKIDARRTFMKLPPLMKGYIRAGVMVGDGAVVDAQFNTTDVCVIMPTYMITDKYVKHYERTLDKPLSRNAITTPDTSDD